MCQEKSRMCCLAHPRPWVCCLSGPRPSVSAEANGRDGAAGDGDVARKVCRFYRRTFTVLPFSRRMMFTPFCILSVRTPCVL